MRATRRATSRATTVRRLPRHAFVRLDVADTAKAMGPILLLGILGNRQRATIFAVRQCKHMSMFFSS